MFLNVTPSSGKSSIAEALLQIPDGGPYFHLPPENAPGGCP
ncbi:hypothetical protein ACFWNZ_33345 [Streptomyces rubiginosohelvolus]